MLGMNWQSFPGVFSRNPNAELPKSTFTYEDYQEQQKSLTVPQTFPQNMTPGGLSYSWKKINGTMTCVIESPTGRSTEWKNSEIFSPPEEYLAKQDVERQKAEERKMLAGLSDEQKELLRKLEAGELFGKSKLVEESLKKKL